MFSWIQSPFLFSKLMKLRTFPGPNDPEPNLRTFPRNKCCMGTLFLGKWQHMFAFNKSDVKRQNTLGCLDQYTCRGLRLWNSLDCEAIQVHMSMRRGWRLWNCRGNEAVYVVMTIMSWLFIFSGGETGHYEILTFNLNFTLKVKVNLPRVMSYHTAKLTIDTQTHINAENNNTQ